MFGQTHDPALLDGVGQPQDEVEARRLGGVECFGQALACHHGAHESVSGLGQLDGHRAPRCAVNQHVPTLPARQRLVRLGLPELPLRRLGVVGMPDGQHRVDRGQHLQVMRQTQAHGFG